MTRCQRWVIVGSVPASASQRSASKSLIESTTLMRIALRNPTYSRDNAAKLASASSLELRRQPHVQPDRLAEQLTQRALDRIGCSRAVVLAHVQVSDNPVGRLLDQHVLQDSWQILECRIDHPRTETAPAGQDDEVIHPPLKQ